MAKKVMVVDDDAFMRETIADILNEEGYDALAVGSGNEAVTHFKEASYDYVLLDLKMEGMDGYDTLLALKQMDDNLRAVIMTAYYEDDTIKKCLQEGVFGVLNKPLDMREVVSHLELINTAKVVMIAEDDCSLRESIADILREKGFHVVEVSDKETALEAAKKCPPRVLILDMNFPHDNGKEIMTSLSEIIPGVKTLVVTGYAEDMCDEVTECLNLGAECCMSKPVDMDKLVTKINDCF